MSTFATIPSAVTIGGGIVLKDRVITRTNYEGCFSEWEFQNYLSLNMNSYYELSLHVFANIIVDNVIPNVYNYGSFMRDVELKVDGSNFIDWYQHLISILISNDLPDVIREQLGDTPDNSVSEEDDDEYCTHRHLFMTVQYTILHFMKFKLRVRVNDTNMYDVVDELKALYCKSELWSMSIWTGFLSTVVEESTC